MLIQSTKKSKKRGRRATEDLEVILCVTLLNHWSNRKKHSDVLQLFSDLAKNEGLSSPVFTLGTKKDQVDLQTENNCVITVKVAAVEMVWKDLV